MATCKFHLGDNVLEGELRRKLTDTPYSLVMVGSKRYVVKDDEFVKEEEANEAEIRPEGQNVQESPPRRKRGRPRKLG